MKRSERRLGLLRHVLRMGDFRIPRQAIQWVGTEGIQEEAGRTRKNWMDIVRRDLKDMNTIPVMKPKN